MKSVNKAAKSLLACYSFRGHDFELEASGPARRRYAKKTTNRARRREARAVAQDWN